MLFVPVRRQLPIPINDFPAPTGATIHIDRLEQVKPSVLARCHCGICLSITSVSSLFVHRMGLTAIDIRLNRSTLHIQSSSNRIAATFDRILLRRRLSNSSNQRNAERCPLLWGFAKAHLLTAEVANCTQSVGIDNLWQWMIHCIESTEDCSLRSPKIYRHESKEWFSMMTWTCVDEEQMVKIRFYRWWLPHISRCCASHFECLWWILGIECNSTYPPSFIRLWETTDIESCWELTRTSADAQKLMWFFHMMIICTITFIWPIPPLWSLLLRFVLGNKTMAERVNWSQQNSCRSWAVNHLLRYDELHSSETAHGQVWSSTVLIGVMCQQAFARPPLLYEKVLDVSGARSSSRWNTWEHMRNKVLQ
jgi:hypothetical protein